MQNFHGERKVVSPVSTLYMVITAGPEIHTYMDLESALERTENSRPVWTLLEVAVVGRVKVLAESP